MRHKIPTILTATLAILVAADTYGAETDLSLYAPACCHEVQRAGFPRCIADWAKPNNTCDYTGYYVGGGAYTYRNPCRCPYQGTWGWDYAGRIAPRIVELGWWHPPREQGGAGSYEPDGGPPCFEKPIPE
jgi:hypothetical protein